MNDRKEHILIVDDDTEIRHLLSRFLEVRGFRTSKAGNGASMFKILSESKIDLIVLDLMLPGDDGLTLIKKIRAEGNDVPIIMLTAVGEDTDRIIGLEVGADDYMPKPFNPRELLARIKSVLKRFNYVPKAISAEEEDLCFLSFRLDVASRKLFDENGDNVQLSSGEYDLLTVFVERAGRVLSRDTLLDVVKGRNAVLFDRAIDVQISRLRKKLGDNPKNPQIITTVRGGGYMFVPKVSKNLAEDSKDENDA